MNKCQSCGMPMQKPDDYGGGRMGNAYCKYCTDGQGNLLPQGVVREKMIKFQMKSLNKSQEQAAEDVDKHMALMPAWQRGGGQMPNEPKKPGTPGGMETPTGQGNPAVSGPKPVSPGQPAGGVPGSQPKVTPPQPAKPSVQTPSSTPATESPASKPGTSPISSPVGSSQSGPVASVKPMGQPSPGGGAPSGGMTGGSKTSPATPPIGGSVTSEPGKSSPGTGSDQKGA
jgi:hypothetical protein